MTETIACTTKMRFGTIEKIIKSVKYVSHDVYDRQTISVENNTVGVC